ncbi:MAG: hypothetical protein ACRD1U_07905 [Vicinamibacterales bacterium]
MTGPASAESVAERALSTLMLVLFRVAFAGLAAGLISWLAAPAAVVGRYLLTAGLAGIIAMPILRLLAAMAAAVRTRDRVLLGATLAVIAILFALTLRDAARLG